MRFVGEAIIDAKFEALQKGGFELSVEAFKTKQPVLMAYLLSESFDVLTIAEKELMLFLSVVIWEANLEVNGPMLEVAESRIGEIDEINWELIANAPGKTFRDKLDVFFNNYSQEDLLAFVEDAITIDEEEEDTDIEVTKEGRQPMFIGLRTLIDCLAV